MELNIDASPHGRGFLIYIDDEEYQITLSSLKLLILLVKGRLSEGDGWVYPEDLSINKYLHTSIYKLNKETDNLLPIENDKCRRCYRLALDLVYFDIVEINKENIIAIGDHFLIDLVKGL
ncbi:MAG: hypothetical protein KAS32_15905 [Candidatus Peribacteraceae bacterium]|nr:hypothetical protein [Candidatus Peribacteraceae bacterium]